MGETWLCANHALMAAPAIQIGCPVAECWHNRTVSDEVELAAGSIEAALSVAVREAGILAPVKGFMEYLASVVTTDARRPSPARQRWPRRRSGRLTYP